MVFNVGAQRSGTYWLQRIVTTHPAISAVPSESALFSHGVAPLFERFHHGARSSEEVGSLFVERGVLVDAVRGLCDAVYAPYLERDAELLAERTAVHVREIDLISEIYPDSRFIHIIRDGRDVARSVVAKPWGPTSIGEAAVEWRDCVLTARRAELPPDRYLEVRYEELLGRPGAVITSVFDWLGLSLGEDDLANALGEARTRKNMGRDGQAGVAAAKWRTGMTSEELREVQAVAGDLLACLGYEPADAVPLSPAPAVVHTRRGVERAKAAVRRRLPEPVRQWPSFRNRQQMATRALGAMLNGQVRQLTALMEPNARVKVVSAAGSEVASGDGAFKLLERTLVEQGVLSGRQLIGDAFPGVPTFAYVLGLERHGRSSDRCILITIREGRLTELTIYVMPLNRTRLMP